ncbi:MAG: hypothetical protein ABI887_05255 [Burkholderiales bacterium]
MTMVDPARFRRPLSPGAGKACRRSFLAALLALPTLSAVINRAWLPSSETVIMRNGWVLSKDD